MSNRKTATGGSNMNTLRRVVNGVLAVLVVGLAVWVGGCSSQPGLMMVARPEREGQAGSSPAPAAAPVQYSPIGATQNGERAVWRLDNLDATRPSGGVIEYPNDLRYMSIGEGRPVNSDAPSGLTARSLPLMGDIPLVGGVFKEGEVRAGEELWVISRNAESRDAAGKPVTGTFQLPMVEIIRGSRCGAVFCVSPSRPDAVAAALKHTAVRASIVGPAAKVDVTQTFENPFSEKIEAVYVFPLPENGAVTEFVMTIGQRRIRAVVRERAEAERIYQQAKSQGYTASLLTQERANIFTQRVANIEPGKSLDIAITYYHTVAEVDGSYQWVFPMVVAPRFNPPGSGGAGVGAVTQGDRGASGQRTEVQYLAPEQRNGHDIDVRVDLEAGVPVESVRCGSHVARIQHVSGSRAMVELTKNDRVPNKDMVVEWKVSGAYAKGGLVYGPGRPGGDEAGWNGGDESFVLMLVPPESRERLQRAPLEMVFVVDRSGSMEGAPIAQARAAVKRGLERLRPGDSFQIIDFAQSASTLGSRPLEATPENIRRGQEFVAGIDAKGGTYMMTGLKAALAFPHDAERLRYVTFLTDGLIGNETEILNAQALNLGESRIFSFGVGSAPNRYLMDMMAKLGHGVSAYVSINDPESSGASTMDLFFDRIERPVLTDVRIDWNGASVSEVTGGASGRLPDLYTGRSVVVAGKVRGGFSRAIRVMGNAGGKTVTMEVQPTKAAADGGRSVAAIWARQKLTDLEERSLVEGWDGVRYADAVKRVALENGLVSQFTALVAVDSSVRTSGTSGVSVAVPVPVADGVRYDTTVGGTGGNAGGGGSREGDGWRERPRD